MASSHNLMALVRSGFNDPWFADVFSRETEALTKVLQKSMCGAPPLTAATAAEEQSFRGFKTEVGTPSASVPTVSGGSENETAGSKRRSVGGVCAAGKNKKRKPRASKRATTTYITADAAHFRQMVQQVTGFNFSAGGAGYAAPAAHVLKPEPQRAVQRLQPSGCLPTLDTSAFLLDQNKTVDPTATTALLPPPQPAAAGMSPDAAAGFDFDFFSSFPTLESWKTVM